MKIVPI